MAAYISQGNLYITIKVKWDMLIEIYYDILVSNF